MSTIHDFDDIRPFLPEELPVVYDRLLNDPQFVRVASFCMPDLPLEALSHHIRSCKNNLEFQMNVGYRFVERLLAHHSTLITADFNDLDIVNNRFTFVSNHRDIVLDSAILAKMLVDNGCPTTCEIAIGDNLLSLPWVKDLVRINKSFIVYRSLPARDLLHASVHLSEYMHFVINEKRDNIWIAQREGRAKDSDDRTQAAIIKMLSLSGSSSSVADRLRELHIVPLSIAYEYDPCDYLKAREMQLKRDNPAWKKSSEDDVLSMRTGIMGDKGRIAYCCGSCIDEKLDCLMSESVAEDGVKMNKNHLYERVAHLIDDEIHAHYKIFPSNIIAYTLLKREGNVTLQHDTTDTNFNIEAKDVAAFEEYVTRQIEKIDIDNRDDSFLRRQILTMYANPYINYLRVHTHDIH